MSHLTSLLMCLISAVNNVAALEKVQSPMPEARSGSAPWEQRYSAISPKSLHPHRPDGIRGPQKPSSLIDPKSFSIELEGPPTDQDWGSAQVYSGKSENQNKLSKDSTKPGWNLKFSFPSITTTEAPTTKSESKEKNLFRYLGSSQGKLWSNPSKFPGVQKPDYQKPLNPHKQSHLVKFLDTLLQGGSSEQSSQKQKEKLVFKPLMQQQLSHSHSSGSLSSPYNPNPYGMGQGESGTHTPIQSAHYTPKWLQLHKPQTSDDDVKSILQYVQTVNGRLMIPVDKCPGFEKLEEYLKGHYHQHGQFPYGYIHQHGQPHHTHQQGKLPHAQVYQQGKLSHVHVDQQGPNPHGHVYKPWTPPQTPQSYPTKPSYAEFYQYGGGPAPNPSEPSQEPNDYLKWWQNKYPGGHQQHPKPGQTYSYMYQEHDKQQQQPGEQPQHSYYKVPVQSIPYYAPPGWP